MQPFIFPNLAPLTARKVIRDLKPFAEHIDMQITYTGTISVFSSCGEQAAKEWGNLENTRVEVEQLPVASIGSAWLVDADGRKFRPRNEGINIAIRNKEQ